MNLLEFVDLKLMVMNKKWKKCSKSVVRLFYLMAKYTTINGINNNLLWLSQKDNKCVCLQIQRLWSILFNNLIFVTSLEINKLKNVNYFISPVKMTFKYRNFMKNVIIYHILLPSLKLNLKWSLEATLLSFGIKYLTRTRLIL